jgi:hypothetical protein
MDIILRPGVSDAACLGLLVVGSLAGAHLEPSHRDFWLGFPLLVEVPLLCTTLLLILSRSRVANTIATVIHVAILAMSALFLALSAFLLVTILFAGLAIIIGPIFVILALNSAYTLNRIGARNRIVAAHVNSPARAISQNDER